MTEAEWLASDDPAAMLAALEEATTALDAMWPSNRKLRLFAVAAERHSNLQEKDARLRRAIAAKCDVAELWVDGLATEADVFRARHPGRGLPEVVHFPDAISDAYRWVQCSPAEVWNAGAKEFLSALLREVLGNPFRPVRPLPPDMPDWCRLTGLAERAYHDRDWAVLPVLADALEDAGCDSADLLAHLRGPGPHVRGCWALDAVLGRD